jgi:hypothetical protein
MLLLLLRHWRKSLKMLLLPLLPLCAGGGFTGE